MSVELKPQDRGIPSEVYLPLIDSLFKETRSLLLGTVINAVAIFATYWKTGHVTLLVCAIAFAVVGYVRISNISRYNAARDLIRTNADAKAWETIYVIGASTSVGLLGIWCYLAFAIATDAFTQLISFSMTIFYIIGIFGRNFGSPKFVFVQMLCAWLPMSLALLLHGGWYHWLFALLLAPFFLAVRMISDRLRRTLLDAIIATQEMSALAAQFDSALTNMPHGLLMFGIEGKVLVSNRNAVRILGLDRDLDVKGWSFRKLIQECIHSQSIQMADAKAIANYINNPPPGGVKELVVELSDGRWVDFALKFMSDGSVVTVIQDISDRRAAEQTIHRMAHCDSLTGLANRTSFCARLAKEFAHESEASGSALHFLDLDKFKQVNDTLGHSRGDMLLQLVAGRIQSVLRSSDLAARFGGDEFVILQSRVTCRRQAEELAKRIIDELNKPFTIDCVEVAIGASVGIARLPRDAADIEQLLKNADMALYDAKASGRGTWRFFQPEMEALARERRQLETDLRTAIGNDQFELHYQPLVDLKTGTIGTCEALLRWHHPKRGYVSPAEFIPLAEECGAIADIGRMVLSKACHACKVWPNDIRVAVNISPIQFSMSDVAQVVRSVLADTELPPQRLEIEITESALVHDTASVFESLQDLRKLGVKVSLDDFGTGYSSLSYLHSFPLDKVKIDRSFLDGLGRDSRSMTLFSGISRLSKDLGLRVVVEGIETSEQLELIAEEAFAHEGQGYLFSRPVRQTNLDVLFETIPNEFSRLLESLNIEKRLGKGGSKKDRKAA